MKRIALVISLGFILTACNPRTEEPTSLLTPSDSRPLAAVTSPSPTFSAPTPEEPPAALEVAAAEPAASQFDPRTPEVMRRSAEMGAGLAQQRLSLSQYGLQMAQQMGDQAQISLYQQEIEMHQSMLGEFQGWLSNPSAFADEASCLAVLHRMQEYDYRSNTRDMRPGSEIQDDLARYVAHAAWKAGTPEGQQAHQNSLAAMQAQGDARTARHQQNMAQMQAQAASHNARMEGMQAQADARNRAWSADQQNNYEQHQRNVHGIYNEYEYQDPNSGQRYWVPMENENPAVVNPDGTYTELQPYSY